MVYARRRIKDGWGPRMVWEKTDMDPNEILAEVDDEEEDLVF